MSAVYSTASGPSSTDPATTGADMAKIKTFLFNIQLRGEGPNAAAAWRNAVEAFELDPGLPNDVDITEEK